MPRGPRIDEPGMFHHVRARGIGRKKIFDCDFDREDFLARLGRACDEHHARVCAWSVMSNHFHLAIRTGIKPLSKTMTSTLTGYALAYNARYKHDGHVFQNRFKSTVVDEERYFLALLRYIHLNPVRAKMVGSLDELGHYPWTGHSVLMGHGTRAFQEVNEVLGRFGRKVGAARVGLLEYMSMEESKKEAKIFKGGGLRRSLASYEQPVDIKKGKWAYDERILGSSEFVESLLTKCETSNAHQLKPLSHRTTTLRKLGEKLSKEFGVRSTEVWGKSKRRKVSEVRRLLSYAGTRLLCMSGAEVARMMNVTGPVVLRGAAKAEEQWEDLEWLLARIDV